jgi:hypothetical protein
MIAKRHPEKPKSRSKLVYDLMDEINKKINKHKERLDEFESWLLGLSVRSVGAPSLNLNSLEIGRATGEVIETQGKLVGQCETLRQVIEHKLMGKK